MEVDGGGWRWVDSLVMTIKKIENDHKSCKREYMRSRLHSPVKAFVAQREALKNEIANGIFSL